MKISRDFIKKTGAVLLLAVASFFIIRWTGIIINQIPPRGGINESMYVNINGSKEWINIYGKDLDNPVLLYLHGGPGSATSPIDYSFTRKWADVYTVVTWDQRNCGMSYDKNITNDTLTREIMLKDGKEMTEFLRSYLSKDKITLLGHSWGSIYGANLALKYPEYYDAFIGAGQLVDIDENIQRYSMSKPEVNLSTALTVIFNPSYSAGDYIRFNIHKDDTNKQYSDFMANEIKRFSLTDRFDYEVPFFIINGDMDELTNYDEAHEYYENIIAPKKGFFTIKDGAHNLPGSRSEELSKVVHEISKLNNK